jgi:4-diphosphocytidyl-2-C-methyl-D-erythritol kinase
MHLLHGRALDLDRRSTADPLALLSGMAAAGARSARSGELQELVVNDLEQPAFDKLPQLGELKRRLQEEGGFEAVFMTGSGSTIVGVGSGGPRGGG